MRAIFAQAAYELLGGDDSEVTCGESESAHQLVRHAVEVLNGLLATVGIDLTEEERVKLGFRPDGDDGWVEVHE